MAGRFDVNLYAVDFGIAHLAVHDAVVRTLLRAGRLHAVLFHRLARRMAGRFDLERLPAHFLAADGAVNDFVVGAILGAGGCYFVLANSLSRGVAQSGDFFLCNKRFAAHGALFALSQSGLSAGSCFALNDFLGVACSLYVLRLAADFLAADGAVNDFVIGASFGAGGRYFVLSNSLSRGVAQSRDFFSGLHSLAALRANLISGVACFRASGFLCVLKFRGLMLTAEPCNDLGFVAASALLVDICAVFAGHFFAPIVAQCLNRTLFCCITHGAFDNQDTRLDAGGFLYDLRTFIVKAMLGLFNNAVVVVAADGAGILANAGSRAGSFLQSDDFILVGILVNCDFLLSNQNFTADGAFHALSHAGGAAGGGNSRDDLLGMPGCGIQFAQIILFENFTAHRALDDFLAVLGAGCIDILRLASLMSDCGENLDHFIAAELAGLGDRAVLGAGGCNDHFLIVVRNHSVRDLDGLTVRIHRAADRAHEANLGVRGAGCFNNLFLIVMFAGSGNHFRLGCTAAFDGAGIGLLAVFAAGSLDGYAALIPAMRRRNGRIFVSAALRADIFADAGGSAGGRFQSGGQFIGVGIRINRNLLLCDKHFTAHGALLALGQAGILAGRRFAGYDFLGVLAGSGNLLTAEQDFAADGALHTVGATGVAAVGGFCGHNLFGMLAGGGNSLGLGLVANRAGVGAYAVGDAGGRLIVLGLLVQNPLMARRRGYFTQIYRHIVGIYSSAYGADLTVGLAVLGAGWLDVLDVFPTMNAGCRDYLCDVLFADDTGIAFAAVLGAGGRCNGNAFFGFGVALCGNVHGLTAQLLIADRAVYHRAIGTGFGAGGFLFNLYDSLIGFMSSGEHIVAGGSLAVYNRDPLADSVDRAGGSLQNGVILHVIGILCQIVGHVTGEGTAGDDVSRFLEVLIVLIILELAQTDRAGVRTAVDGDTRLRARCGTIYGIVRGHHGKAQSGRAVVILRIVNINGRRDIAVDEAHVRVLALDAGGAGHGAAGQADHVHTVPILGNIFGAAGNIDGCRVRHASFYGGDRAVGCGQREAGRGAIVIDREVIAGHITICQCDRTFGTKIPDTARTIRRGNGDALQCELLLCATFYFHDTTKPTGQITIFNDNSTVNNNDRIVCSRGRGKCMSAKIQRDVLCNFHTLCYIRQQLHSVARLGLSEGTRKGIILLTIDFGHFSRVRREGSHGHKAHRQNADKQADEPFFSSHYESITSINVSKFD